MTPEGKVKVMVKKALHERFLECYHFMPVQNGMGAPSLDILACVHGLFVAIECKRPGGKVTPRQQSTINEILLAGGRAFVVDSREACDDMIKKLEWSLCPLLSPRSTGSS